MGYSAGCMSCIKFMLFAVNFVAWLLGIALIGLAIWIKMDARLEQFLVYMEMEYYYRPIFIFVTVGSLMFLVGFLGCCGVVMENVCMITTYFVFLFIMFVLELAAAAFILTNGTEFSKLDPVLEEKLTFMVYNYNDDYVRWLMDNMQTELRCCGIHNFDDYDKVNLEIPNSCRDPITGQQFKQDCYQGFTYYLERKSGLIGGFALGLCLCHIFAMMMSIYLCMAYRHTEESFA